MEGRPPGEGEGKEKEGWLPPEPSGPEPDVGEQPPPQQPPTVQQPVPQQPPQQPPPPPQDPAPPPPQQPPPQQPQPPYPPPSAPGYGAPPPPPGYPPAGQPPGYPPPQYPPQPPYAPVSKGPGNSHAIAALITSVVSVFILLSSGGISSILSVIASGVAIWLGRSGKRKVDEGETTQHRGLAQAGFIVGIVGVVLGILATLFWVLIIVLAASGELDSDSYDPYGSGISSTVAPLAGAVLRGLI